MLKITSAILIVIGLVGCGGNGGSSGGGSPTPTTIPNISLSFFNYSHQLLNSQPSGTTLTIADAAIWGPNNNINGSPGFHISNIPVPQGGSIVSNQGPGIYRLNIWAIEASTGNNYCKQVNVNISKSQSFGIRFDGYTLGSCPIQPLP